jgi:hypothetical protein
LRAWYAPFAAACIASAAIGACSSHGSNGPTGFACPQANPYTSVSAACHTCVAQNCNVQAVAEYGAEWQSGDVSGGACGSMQSCLAPCDCSDTSCISSCVMGTSGPCMTAAQNLDDCVEVSNCLGACAMITGSFSSPDASPGDASANDANLDAGAGGG